MRDMAWVVAAWGLIAGCTEGAVVIKVPVQKQCAAAQRWGCSEQADGAVAAREPSVGGEDAERGVDAKHRSSVLASVDEAYGRDESEEDAALARPLPSSAEPVLLALAASVDPSRLLTESITPLRDAARTSCDVNGKASVCVPRQPGPVVVTDVVVPAGCPAELYVGAADAAGTVRWAIPVTAAGTHGGNFFVRGDEHVTVAARGAALTQPGDVRCAVTWSGFRPRIVPLMPGMTAATLAP